MSLKHDVHADPLAMRRYATEMEQDMRQPSTSGVARVSVVLQRPRMIGLSVRGKETDSPVDVPSSADISVVTQLGCPRLFLVIRETVGAAFLLPFRDRTASIF